MDVNESGKYIGPLSEKAEIPSTDKDYTLVENRESFKELKKQQEELLDQAIKRVPQLNNEELENRFKYHAPKDTSTQKAHEEIRQACFQLSLFINLQVPEGREKALAITKLEETMMWANAGIARNS